MNQREEIDLRIAPLALVKPLYQQFHGYGGMSKTATYSLAVVEEQQRIVASFLWQPPAPACACALSAAPGGAGVLALSRMVAVPKEDRKLRHISKALKRIMWSYIDRFRWPVLVTYSDASLGHTGHVYRCSGWQADGTTQRPYYVKDGVRVSSYSSGKRVAQGARAGTTTLTRWVHRIVPQGDELAWMNDNGWFREAIPGKVWASGLPAYTWVFKGAK